MPFPQRPQSAGPLRPCWSPGCAALSSSGACDRHPRRHGWAPDRERGTKQERGYGAEWERIRAEVLRRDRWLCQVCRLADATEVDHVAPKALGGTDEPGNLQAICNRCHRAKTARDRAASRQFGRGRVESLGKIPQNRARPSIRASALENRGLTGRAPSSVEGG